MSVRDVDVRLRARFKHFGIPATSSQVNQLVTYFGLLAKWNNTVNLTALALEPLTDAAIDRLFVEPFLAALIAGKAVWAGTEKQATARVLIDIGSGGGSPAIPLTIALPGTQLRMIEAKARKAAFLREAIRHLELTDAQVLNARTEGLLSRSDLHESADIISIRAVRGDRRLWSTVSAFTKPGGIVLWFRASTEQPGPTVFFPTFRLQTVEQLVPVNHSELAILRKES